jgi:nitroreductase
MDESSRETDMADIGEEVPLLEGIRTTRAIRRLSSEPVPPELIRKVVEAGTFAPSGGNRQPWSFIAVSDPERRAWVAERYNRAFREYIAPALEVAAEFSPAKRRNMESAITLAESLAEVPVHLFVAGWTRRGQPQHQSLYPAIQNILLACRAVGLGACITSVHLAFGREIDEYLGLSEKQPSCALIPIGWPLIPYKRPVRKSVDSCLYWERFED